MGIVSTTFANPDWFVSEKGLRHDPTAISRWDLVGSNITDLDLVVLVSATGADSGQRNIVRIRDDEEGDPSYVRCNWRAGDFELAEVVNGNFNQLAATPFTFVLGIQYLVRVFADGADVRAKAWRLGTDEPVAWTVTGTTVVTSPGSIQLQTNDAVSYYSWVALDTSGGSAPLPGESVDAGQEATDFGHESLGEPDDWTQSAGGGSHSIVDEADGIEPLDIPYERLWRTDRPMLVEAEATAEDGFWLRRRQQSGQEWQFLRWTEIPADVGDFEAVITGLIVSTTALTRELLTLIFRADEDGNGYGVGFVRVSSQGSLRFWRIDEGDATLIANVNGVWSPNDVMSLRVLVEGTSIKARAWLASEEEPGTWDIDTTNETYASGMIGVGDEEVSGGNDAWTLDALLVDSPDIPEDSVIVGPTSTVQANQWRSSIDNSTNLHIPLADGETDTWARSGANPLSDTSIAGFDPLVDPEVNEGHLIRYQYSKDAAGGRDIDLVARIAAGNTIIASQLHENIGDEIVEATLELTEEQVQEFRENNGYAGLRVHFMSDHSGGGPARRARVYTLQFELPAHEEADSEYDPPVPPPPIIIPPPGGRKIVTVHGHNRHTDLN